MYRTKHDPTGDRVDYFFEIDHWNGEPTNCEPQKCDDIQWFPIDAMPENIMDHVKVALLSVQNKVPYSELGLKDVMFNPNTTAN